MDWSTSLLEWFSGDCSGCSPSRTDFNWTGPLLDVISALNESLIGPQRVEIYNRMTLFNLLSYAEQYGVLMGVVSIFVMSQILFSKVVKSSDKNEKKFVLTFPSFLNPRLFFGIFSFLLFLLILPIIMFVLMGSFLNKKLVHLILKRKHCKNFVSLLNGNDTVWALEEDNARSIINVIASIELNQDKTDANSKTNILLESLRKTVSTKLKSSDPVYSKMLYKRFFEMGYFYWGINTHWCINDFIRPMEVVTKDTEISHADLTRFVANNCNASMPYDNTGSWEILVSDKPMKKDEAKYADTSSKIFPVLFRIHHSLGDGVVLLKLLLKTIADEKHSHCMSPIHGATLSLKNTLKTCFDSLGMVKWKNYLIKKVYNLIKSVIIVFLVPGSLMRQILRPADKNVLHGPTLTGKKVVAWVSDNICEESLLKKIKRMKKRVPGATFSDLFITALSASHHKYFTKRKSMAKISRQNTLPECITSVVPVRMDSTELNINSEQDDRPFELENKFSVGMLSIPIKNQDAKDKKLTLLQRLVEVRRQTSELRHSADFQVNYWLMSIAGDVLPEAILRPMMCSEQATLVVSNLPGPTDITICGGHSLHDMAFFVPHRGTTGIGVTLLTCNGRVQLGLMADAALISSSADAQDILTSTVEELNNLDCYTSRRMSSQRNSMEMHTINE